MRRLPLAFASLIALAAVSAGARHAQACGGCFAPAVQSTVVNAHRMAFSITRKQTVLWDQIRYSGDPAEFAWVLPVRPGARVELSRDEWFAALDASTQPVVVYGGAVAGCSLAGCSSAGNSGAGGSDTVEVLAQNVVGPYETVTLRSTNPRALVEWLASHEFVLPSGFQSTVDAYVAGHFDFIALRLRPQCSERAMQPVRVISPGADPTLPLRMVAAGVGAEVDILLYIVGEGRYRPQNFPEQLFDDSRLTWDTNRGGSNYETLAQSLMALHGGTSWLTEAASQPDLGGWYPGHPEKSGAGPSPAGPSYSGSGYATPSNPGLAPTYFAFCRGDRTVPGAASGIVSPQPCSPDAGVDAASDASDAGADALDDRSDAAAGDAESDGAVVMDAEGFESGGGSEAAASDGSNEDAFDALEAFDASDAATDVVDGPDAADASQGAADAGDDARDDAASNSALPPPDAAGVRSMQPPPPDPCVGFDDLDVALDGAHPQDVWVTRLRARLPVYALANDLVLEASPEQIAVSNVHQVRASPAVRTRQGCATGSRPRDAFGTAALAGITLLGVGAILRRRRR